jgi:hypothetical protein
MTLVEAEAKPLFAPGQPLVMVNEAVLFSVEPHEATVVALITCA